MRTTLLTCILIAALPLTPLAIAEDVLTSPYATGTRTQLATVGHTAHFVAPADATSVTISVDDDASDSVVFDACLNLGRIKHVCSPFNQAPDGREDLILEENVNSVTVSADIPAGTDVYVDVYVAYASATAQGFATSGVVTVTFS